MRSQLEQCPNHMVSQSCPDGITCKYVQRLLNEPTATDYGHEMMSFFSSRFSILGTGLSKWSECEDVKIQVSHWGMSECYSSLWEAPDKCRKSNEMDEWFPQTSTNIRKPHAAIFIFWLVCKPIGYTKVANKYIALRKEGTYSMDWNGT